MRDRPRIANNDDDDQDNTTTYVVVGALSVVALLAAYAVLHELCDHSSDPNCKNALTK